MGNSPTTRIDPFGLFGQIVDDQGNRVVFDSVQGLLDALVNVGDGTIVYVKFSGHAGPDGIQIGPDEDDWIVNSGNTLVGGPNQSDIGAELRRVLDPEGLIYLSGCHTGSYDDSGANLAEATSNYVPGVKVKGNTTYSFGFGNGIFGYGRFLGRWTRGGTIAGGRVIFQDGFPIEGDPGYVSSDDAKH